MTAARYRRAFAAGLLLLAARTPSHSQDSEPIFGTTVVIPSGLRGELYFLPRNTMKLPGFGALDAVGVIYASKLDIAIRQFTQGFPGVTDRMEWFAIDYAGRFWIEQPGTYEFALTSDDGSKLYIDGRVAIDNDGIHPALRRTAAVALAGGIHRLRLSYFQGPRLEIALVLEVRAPGGQFHAFSTDEFRPPADPDRWKYKNGTGLDGVAEPAAGDSAPPAARKAFLAGAEALADSRLREAEEKLARATEIDPKYAPAWSLLGMAAYEKAIPEQARAAWQKALAADPAYIKAAVHLASLDLEQRHDEQAARITAAQIARGAVENPVLYFCDAVANAHLGRLNAAEKSAREAIRLDVANEVPRAEYLLGMLLADQGDRAGALDHMRRYLAIAPDAADAADVRKSIALVEQSRTVEGPPGSPER